MLLDGTVFRERAGSDWRGEFRIVPSSTPNSDELGILVSTVFLIVIEPLATF